MGACVASKLVGEEEVVSICRERKRLMKLAVEKRYALADAHCRYSHSLYAVSAAIKLFVARHSSPCSQYLIEFPPPNCLPPQTPPAPTENVITNPMFLQQHPSESTHETIAACQSCSSDSSTSSDYGDEEEEERVVKEKVRVNEIGPRNEQQSCGYYYMGMPPPMSSPQRDFGGWDFFNPFAGVRPEVISRGGGGGSGFQQNSEDYLKAVREEEGIPELEEEGGREGDEKKNVAVGGDDCCGGDCGAFATVEEKGSLGNNFENGVEAARTMSYAADVSQGEKGLTVIDTPVRGRELLDALKDVEDHFVRAYDSCKEVSKMLEANKIQLQSGFEEIKENSTKLIQAITWHRSNTSRSSSCKSLVASSSKNCTSTWTEYKNDLFDDDYGGMRAGSHSLTLGRLYAWEKKLYEEVKAGDGLRQIYEKKCSQLRNKDVRGDDIMSLDKSRASIKELYSRIMVAIRRAESISEKIQKLTAEELQPQIIELLQGLTHSWKIMLESHETQNMIMFEVKTYECPTYGKYCSDSHRHATLQLETEIRTWRGCFMEYVEAQRSYVESLHGWLSKFIVPEVEFCSSRSSFPPLRANGPPLYMICRDWLSYMENLPDRAVASAMKSFVKDVRVLWAQQGDEQDQKRKVEKLAKELDKKTLAYQKAEHGNVETKLLEYQPGPDAQKQEEGEDSQPPGDYYADKKEVLDNCRRKLGLEKEKHHRYMQETQRTTLNGFQTGFSLVFDSLVQFSKASVKMYNDMVNKSHNLDNPSRGSSQAEDKTGHDIRVEGLQC